MQLNIYNPYKHKCNWKTSNCRSVRDLSVFRSQDLSFPPLCKEISHFVICLATTHIIIHPNYKARAYSVGEDQSADEHLCIKTTRCARRHQARRGGIACDTGDISLPTPLIPHPAKSCFPLPLHPSASAATITTDSPSAATVSVHPSFPIVAPVSPSRRLPELLSRH